MTGAQQVRVTESTVLDINLFILWTPGMHMFRTVTVIDFSVGLRRQDLSSFGCHVSAHMRTLQPSIPVYPLIFLCTPLVYSYDIWVNKCAHRENMYVQGAPGHENVRARCRVHCLLLTLIFEKRTNLPPNS